LVPREALELMLAGSGLVVVADPSSGALVIKVSATPRVTPATAIAPTDWKPPPDRMAGETESAAGVVVLSPFEVRSQSDVGYRAANTVSATRIAVPTEELPMSVSTFTASFIADQKPYDLYDVVKWAPGVHQDNVSPQGWIRYNIRGFTSAAIQRNGFAGYRFIDTTDIARVEVVRGPASLLYGQINPGGVINYITKRPEARPTVEVTASIGDYGYNRAVMDATGPVPSSKEHLLYRLVLMREEIQRFQDFVHGRKYLATPSVTWRFSPQAALTVEYEHFERTERMQTSGVVLRYANNVPVAPYPGLPWNFTYAGVGDYQDFISDGLTVDLTARLGEHVNLRAAYVDSAWDQEWRATGQGGTGLIPQTFIDYYYPPSAGLTSADAMFRRNRWEHQKGGERTGQVDITGTYEAGGVTFRPLLGVRENFGTRYHARQNNNPNVAGSPFYLRPWDLRNPGTWDRAVPFGVEALVPAADSSTSSDAASYYGVLSCSAWDRRLHLLAGYARHELHNDPTRDVVAHTFSPPSSRAANVPQVGALVALSRQVSAFASYSESFLANATMLRVNNIPTTPAVPSVGKGAEIGLKFAPPDGRLSGTISLYRIRASPTGIVTVTSGVDSAGTTQFTDVQGGSQLSQGAEVELLYTPLPALQIMASFSRCDATYERHPTDPRLNGAPLVATPNATFNLWAKYVVPTGALAGLQLSGGVNHVGSMSVVGNNPYLRTEPYTTADLNLGYHFHVRQRRWSADVSIKNLANAHYYASASSWGFPRHVIISVTTKL
jgi:iron complex outermembrane receptor protein